MKTNLVEVKDDGKGIATVTLNRPDKRNALNIPLLEELIANVEKLGGNSAIRVIILAGAGPVFCAGLDLAEAQDSSKSAHSAALLARLFTLLHQLPQATIAAVHGAAVAGGAGLMLACDFAVAAERTRFGFPETHKGLVPAQILTFLMRELQQRDIRELLLLGDLIDTSKALSMRLINVVVPAENLLKESILIACKAMRGAPGATAETKQLIDRLYPSDFNDDLKIALELHEKARNSSEAQEGISAFLEKRPPAWNRNAKELP